MKPQIFIILLSSLLLLLSISHLATSTRFEDYQKQMSLRFEDLYTGASVEHTMPAFKGNTTVITRMEALDLMMDNLDFFDNQTQIAADRGAQIIVFNEMGITGEWQSSRSEIEPFLEPLPQINTTLCQNFKNEFSSVFARLSCMAQKHRIVIVANYGVCAPCSEYPKAQCPNDGQFNINTNAVFDETGKFIAYYFKTHPFPPELNRFDYSPAYTVTHFTTSFNVTFGVFTCFDMLFFNPAIELVDMGIQNFVFPTSWRNYPIYTSPFALATQRGFSYANQVNLIAANNGQGKYTSGSGIYTSGIPIITHYDSVPYADGNQLLVSVLPKNPVTLPKGLMTQEKMIADKIKEEDDEEEDEKRAELRRRSNYNNATFDFPFDPNNIYNTSCMGISIVQAKPGIEISEVISVNDELSCNFTWTISPIETNTTNYFAMVAVSGAIGVYDSLPQKFCLLYHCSDIVCAIVRQGASDTVFTSLSIEGSFKHHEVVYPIVTISDSQLPETGAFSFIDKSLYSTQQKYIGSLNYEFTFAGLFNIPYFEADPAKRK